MAVVVVAETTGLLSSEPLASTISLVVFLDFFFDFFGASASLSSLSSDFAPEAAVVASWAMVSSG